MATTKLDQDAFETAVRLGKIIREKTGLCCEPLADLVWETYGELVGPGTPDQGATDLLRSAFEGTRDTRSSGEAPLPKQPGRSNPAAAERNSH